MHQTIRSLLCAWRHRAQDEWTDGLRALRASREPARRACRRLRALRACSRETSVQLLRRASLARWGRAVRAARSDDRERTCRVHALRAVLRRWRARSRPTAALTTARIRDRHAFSAWRAGARARAHRSARTLLRAAVARWSKSARRHLARARRADWGLRRAAARAAAARSACFGRQMPRGRGARAGTVAADGNATRAAIQRMFEAAAACLHTWSRFARLAARARAHVARAQKRRVARALWRFRLCARAHRAARGRAAVALRRGSILAWRRFEMAAARVARGRRAAASIAARAWLERATPVHDAQRLTADLRAMLVSPGRS